MLIPNLNFSEQFSVTRGWCDEIDNAAFWLVENFFRSIFIKLGVLGFSSMLIPNLNFFDRKSVTRRRQRVFLVQKSWNIYLNRKKAQTARRKNEKEENTVPSQESEQNDDFSWYFNRQIDDPLDRLESYENEVEKEYL